MCNQWSGLREKSKEICKFLFMEANIPFGSLGDSKVQGKLISSLAFIPGSFHRENYHIRSVTAFHNEQGLPEAIAQQTFPQFRAMVMMNGVQVKRSSKGNVTVG